MKPYRFVDLFCGGGGSISGAIAALKTAGVHYEGRGFNHWRTAIETIRANHPEVVPDFERACAPIQSVLPDEIFPTDPERIDSIWASPSCTHHSRAAGKKPKSRQLREQPEYLLPYLRLTKCRRIYIENVKELREWGPILDADTGMEWHNAGTHVEMLCRAAGVELETVYPVRPMLEKFKFRFDRIKGRIIKCGFPTPSCRYCTSEQKVAPMDKFTRQFRGKLLKVTGERWAESKARSTYAEFAAVPRLNSRERTVFGWRPMLAFSEADIWSMVRDTGVPRHVCYDLGCSRLGCAGCIFSKDRDMKIEMRENPHIFDALDRMEVESGYTMSMSGKRIRDRIR